MESVFLSDYVDNRCHHNVHDDIELRLKPSGYNRNLQGSHIQWMDAFSYILFRQQPESHLPLSHSYRN